MAVLVICLMLLAACSGEEQAGRDPGSTDLTPTGPGSVRIAPDLFGPLGDDLGSHESVVLSGDFDADVAVVALTLAGARFMLVDEEGTEYSTYEELEQGTLYGPKELYSPNYVADPRILADGIELYVDCKGEVAPPMGATFRRIIREELERAGIRNAVVRNSPLRL